MNNSRRLTFSKKSFSDWKTNAKNSLKGKTVESLQRTTYENIILKPLYTRQNELPVPDYSGGSDFRRGTHPLGYITDEWRVAQRISYQTLEELKEKLKETLEKGQSAISFEVSEELFDTKNSLSRVLLEKYHNYPFAINAKGLHPAFLSILANIANQATVDKISGYIGADPLALFAEEGVVSEEFLRNWLRAISQANKQFPDLRTILVDTTPFHNGGANAVQELGIAVAEGVFFLDYLKESGMELEQILGKIVFQFSIGSHFFTEIAKLRAARVLWNRITGLYGAKDLHRGMIIAAETSSFTKTIHDPHVNLLRAGNEAFAACLGGVQYLHVEPFDSLTGSSSYSERIARNTQLVLKEEAHLQRVIDPAGGSWYIESLTNELAEKAWGFFQQIEAAGGMLESLKSNWLQRKIATVFDRRNKDVQTRKQSVIGTNVYVNLDEKIPAGLRIKSEPSFVKGIYSTTQIESILKRRLAEPFEEHRRKTRHLEQKGPMPSMGLICLGEIKEHKPRLDFVRGFLAAGGLRTVESQPILALEEAKRFITEQKLPFFCFCGTDEQYELTGHDILNALRTDFPDVTFYLAGLPEKEHQQQWQMEGVNDFIHVKTNCCAILSVFLNEWEVWTNEESKA